MKGLPHVTPCASHRYPGEDKSLLCEATSGTTSEKHTTAATAVWGTPVASHRPDCRAPLGWEEPPPQVLVAKAMAF